MSAKAANKNGTDRTFAEASKHIQVINNHGSCDKGFSSIIVESNNCQNVTMSLTLGVIAKTP